MNWFCENWAIIVGLLALLIMVICGIIWFIKLPSDKKVENVKKWLRAAVTEAERELGEKTGQLKLAKVYQMAVAQFPWIATFISYETFDLWVKEALDWLDKQLETNPAIQKYVKGE